jgi:hypothetical protein
MRKQHLLLILTASFLVLQSCNSSNGKKIKKVRVEKVTPEDQTPRIPVTYSRPGAYLPNSALADYQRALKSHKYLPFLSITQDGNFFVSANKKFDIYSLHDVKILNLLRFGLVAANGDTLLPNKYNKIGNLGQIAYGYVEVQEGNKYKLYDYLNRRFIGSAYDVIFPSKVMGYLAIGKNGSNYEKLYDDGTVKSIKEEEVIGYGELISQLKFDVRSEDFGLWINTELFLDGYHVDTYAGLYVSPSFIYKLGVVPQFVTGVVLKDSEIGIEEFKTKKILQSKKGKTNSLLYSMFERGIDGRGWMTEEQYLISINKNNSLHKRIKINEFSDYGLQNKCQECGDNTFKFLNDSIVEVQYWFFNDSQYAKKGMDSLFQAMTQYSYFKILKNGDVKPLFNQCLFPMASVKTLTEDDMKGCFLKSDKHIKNITQYPVSEQFLDWDGDDVSGWILEYNHLATKDIRYMINEIYARHGYIFGDPRINNLFRSFTWYKPRSKNVDHLLTPIEKQNIYFLQLVEKRLKSTNESELSPKRRVLVWAG